MVSDLIATFDFLDYDAGPWVAGGSALKIATSKPHGTSDVDIFCTNKAQYLSVFKWFTDNYSHLSNEVITNAFHQFTVHGVRIQLITCRYFQSITEMFADFDFSVCCFTTNGVSVIGTTDAWTDTAKHILRLVGPCRKTIQRLPKYCRLGFTPEKGLLGRIVDNLPEGSVSKGFHLVEELDDSY